MVKFIKLAFLSRVAAFAAPTIKALPMRQIVILLRIFDALALVLWYDWRTLYQDQSKKINSFDENKYFDTHTNTNQLPNVGISVQGGRYKSLLHGA